MFIKYVYKYNFFFFFELVCFARNKTIAYVLLFNRSYGARRTTMVVLFTFLGRIPVPDTTVLRTGIVDCVFVCAIRVIKEKNLHYRLFFDNRFVRLFKVNGTKTQTILPSTLGYRNNDYSISASSILCNGPVMTWYFLIFFISRMMC